jgi:bacterial polymer biosynthesis proteins, WecB/TagA/CpsF family
MKENILGVDVCPVNMAGALNQVDEIIKDRNPGFIVAINPEKIMKALNDQSLMDLLNAASLQIPDGVGILIASRMRGGSIKSRVTGIDLMMNICRHASEKGYRIYMLGASPGTAEEAARRLKEMYPEIIISGTHDGYFKDKEAEVVDEIARSNSDILFVAMGSPKQEYWIKANMNKLNVPLLMGVGGSYDVICGSVKRAPRLMRNLGLEWLHRLIKEPWRLKRMLVLPIFLIKALMYHKE